EGAVAKARAEGVDASALAVLEAEAGHVDSADEKTRKAALTRVGQTLSSLGLPVGFEPVAPPKREVAAPLPRVEKETAEDEPAAPQPLGGAGGAPKPRRGKAAAVSEEEAPAKLLSIAPAEGPLSTPLKAIGLRLNPRLVGLLNKKGIRRAGDILFLLPRVYEDRRKMKKIAQLVAGERGTIIAEVRKVEEGFGRRKTFRA